MPKRYTASRFDTFNTILGYDYVIHTWKYDCKYYLKDRYWVDPYTGQKISKIQPPEEAVIKQYTPLVEKREKEYRQKDTFAACRKRTCVCKQCKTPCMGHCDDCKEKIKICDKKENVYPLT